MAVEMNLETEFRIRLQLRALGNELARSCADRPRSGCLIDDVELEPSTWVKLKQRPDPFSSDEALLLCRCSATQWLAWVPDYGEMLVSPSDLQLMEQDL